MNVFSLGCCGNMKTVIRNESLTYNVARQDTPEILSCTQMRTFWVSWENGHVKVGFGKCLALVKGKTNHLLKWQLKFWTSFKRNMIFVISYTVIIIIIILVDFQQNFVFIQITRKFVVKLFPEFSLWVILLLNDKCFSHGGLLWYISPVLLYDICRWCRHTWNCTVPRCFTLHSQRSQLQHVGPRTRQIQVLRTDE